MIKKSLKCYKFQVNEIKESFINEIKNCLVNQSSTECKDIKFIIGKTKLIINQIKQINYEINQKYYDIIDVVISNVSYYEKNNAVDMIFSIYKKKINDIMKLAFDSLIVLLEKDSLIIKQKIMSKCKEIEHINELEKIIKSVENEIMNDFKLKLNNLLFQDTLSKIDTIVYIKSKLTLD